MFLFPFGFRVDGLGLFSVHRVLGDGQALGNLGNHSDLRFLDDLSLLDSPLDRDAERGVDRLDHRLRLGFIARRLVSRRKEALDGGSDVAAQ